MSSSSSSHRLSLPLFAFTLFLSASLLFAIQPMIGKMLLPLVGGAPAGWVTAMAFFQVALLAGYLVAHLLSRCTPRAQGTVYIAGMALSALLLPVSLPPNIIVAGPGDIFALLAKTVGLPFVILSATSSTLQRLFAATHHKDAKDPYFLYVASNLGSLAGLFAYPFALEPLAGLSLQSHLLFGAHILILVLAAACLFFAGKGPQDALAAQGQTPQKGERLKWLLLSFIPASLLMAVTTHVTTDIFSAPLLWVLPLAIYIATFIEAFGKKDLIPLKDLRVLQAPAVVLAMALIYAFHADLRVSLETAIQHLAAFGITALFCHKQLAAARPEKGRLTEFYLMISLGGALAGLVNAFIIPVAFERLIEYPLLLAASLLLHPFFWRRPSRWQVAALTLSLGGLALLGYALSIQESVAAPFLKDHALTILEVILFASLVPAAFHPKTAFAAVLSLVLMMEFFSPKNLLSSERNFFGVIKVTQSNVTIDGKAYPTRHMYHGTTSHGFQIEDKAFEKTVTSYFTKQGPVGQGFALVKPKDVLVIGLGTGSMNCYRAPGREISFIEIDPAVVEVAKRDFTFLSACSMPRIIVGDGRLELGKMDEKFDMIVADAFSSDSVPAHLITREAIAIYAEKLKPGGVILFNLSNRYINLSGTLAATALSLGLDSRYAADIKPEAPYAYSSQWLAVTADKGLLQRLEKTHGWRKITPPSGLRPWTDDYTNLLSTLRIRKGF